MSRHPDDLNLPPIEPSFWAAKLGITDINKDRVKWNSDWEKALGAFGRAREVVNETLKGLNDLYGRDNQSSASVAAPAPAHDQPAADATLLEPYVTILTETQENAARGIREILAMEDGRIDTIWLLLSPSEQKKYLLEGIQLACTRVLTFGQDLRAFCPDITVSKLGAQNGKAFLDLINCYHELYESTEKGKVFFYPNAWFDQAAIDFETSPSPNAQVLYKGVALMRNEFITWFIISTLYLLTRDTVAGGGQVPAVLDFILNTDQSFSASMARVKTTLRDKPLTRCENCTKTPEEIGPNARFMVCSTCKSKLDFTVRYCSQECQKADWKTHKRNCGKKKVSKGLPGTAGDHLWMFQDPSVAFLRDLPKNATLKTVTTAIGIGPAQYTRPVALDTQVSMLEKDKEADYFLFDDKRQPVRFVIDKPLAKWAFRVIRQVAMTNPEKRGSEALGEYMIKFMAKSPGLSRELIVKQFTAEYGEGAPEKVAATEKKSAEAGRTCIEAYVANFERMLPPVFG
ncbi:hypothetical protein HYDPIDRAFT_32345 [Hydnomerulius pinastri MD-312]|uniref:MYND-type domain-containing protein n=1 Tax=Hydnomerulius pinastri MD-312 TaxID=994086 RepID=A0A0C9VRD4_9AGAM|nr:hypothetical protein HYDPIDRAFT_32345 [Hydnomerulius pinastri MD-312]